MASIFENLRKFFSCCSNPTTIDSDEPAVSDTGRELPAVSTVSQESILQVQLHPVVWEDPIRSPVDLQGIDQVDAIVKRPDDMEQTDLFPVSWTNVNKGPVIWGGEEGDSSPEWEGDDKVAKEQVKSLPLPWEGRRGGFVPFDGKTFGPSWGELSLEINMQPDDIQAIKQVQSKPDRQEGLGAKFTEDNKAKTDGQDSSAAKAEVSADDKAGTAIQEGLGAEYSKINVDDKKKTDDKSSANNKKIGSEASRDDKTSIDDKVIADDTDKVDTRVSGKSRVSSQQE